MKQVAWILLEAQFSVSKISSLSWNNAQSIFACSQMTHVRSVIWNPKGFQPFFLISSKSQLSACYFLRTLVIVSWFYLCSNRAGQCSTNQLQICTSQFGLVLFCPFFSSQGTIEMTQPFSCNVALLRGACFLYLKTKIRYIEHIVLDLRDSVATGWKQLTNMLLYHIYIYQGASCLTHS